MKKTAKIIWESGNYINECLIRLAKMEIIGKEDPSPIESLSVKQGLMIRVVKELNAINPNGPSLKELARHLGITEPSASVMLINLVRKGYLKNIPSASDRREIHIQLSDTVANYFASIDEAIYRKIVSLAGECGENTLTQWHDLLMRLRTVLESKLSDINT